MSEITEDQLCAYLLGELSPEQADSIAQALAESESLRADMEKLQTQIASVDHLLEEQPLPPMPVSSSFGEGTEVIEDELRSELIQQARRRDRGGLGGSSDLPQGKVVAGKSAKQDPSPSLLPFLALCSCLAAAGFLAFKFLPINDGSANKSLVELKEEQGQQSAPKSEAVEQILTLEESLNAEERELLQQLRDLESESESVQEADSSIRAQLAKDAPTYDDYEKLREAEANLLKGEDSNQGGQKRRSMYMPLQEEKERVLTSPAREVGQ